MLDWLSNNALDGNGPSGDDAPDTPAHIFAAKAFKSALFGTPAPPPDTEKKASLGLPSLDLPKPAERNVSASPAKGILLTPGTVASKRKTVSFGASNPPIPEEVEGEKETADTAASLESAKPAAPTANSSASRPVRRSLFNRPKPFQPTSLTTLKAATKDDGPAATSRKADESTVDVTVDLGQPRSVSGRHWMKEYQRDHAVSKTEMKKLIRYSQNAKTHAAKRDREAARLREKLEQSEERVKKLEDEVSALRIDKEPSLGRAGGTEKETSVGKAEEATDPDKSEFARLRRLATEASDKAAKLERENEDFRRSILKVKDEMKKYEKRHKEWTERRKQKDERHAAQRKALKEKVIGYRDQLQQEFDDFQENANAEKADLLREIHLLREQLPASSHLKTNPPTFDDPLRQLLARVHEQTPRKTAPGGTHVSGKENRRNGDAKDKTAPNAPLERLRDEWRHDEEQRQHHQESSPTILESHIQRASRQGDPPQPMATILQSPSKAKPSVVVVGQAPQPTFITFSQDQDIGGSKARRRANQADVTQPAARAKNEIRVKPRHGLTGRPAAATSAARSGLTPEREAAARLRIAQRSAEKQRSTKFLFGGDGWAKENRDILAERPLNRI